MEEAEYNFTMSVFSFHLVETSVRSSLTAIWNPPKPRNVSGLVHAECLLAMTLGSRIFSLSRILPRELVVFAQWENESAIDAFLEQTKFGKLLTNAWHVRLRFLRQWGSFEGFEIPDFEEVCDANAPVVAVTLAKMKMLQVPRFIRWGRPVEKLVRDHPSTTLSLASTRLLRTVSTFSIWESQKEMLKMVHGGSAVKQPKRHSEAMRERERKNFHTQFTTLRFKAIGEYGDWKGKSNFVPNLNE